MTITDSKKSFVKCGNNQKNYLVNLITPQCTSSVLFCPHLCTAQGGVPSFLCRLRQSGTPASLV